MSGSLLASAPPLTVIQKNGANGATGATYDQADTHDQAPPRCPRDYALPRPHAEKEKKRDEHVNVATQDPTWLTSTALQTCNRQTRHPPSTLFTGATQKASNSFGNKASDPCRPHAFLAGLNQSADLAKKTRTERRVPGEQLACQTAHPIHFHRRVTGRKKRRIPQSRH